MIYNKSYENIYSKCNGIVKVCKKLNIDTVAGPASSGVVIAVSVFMIANQKKYPMNAILLRKEGYVRQKHSSGVKYLGDLRKVENILVVDDLVSTGESMLYALDEVKKECFDINIIGCLSSSFGFSSLSLINRKYPNMRFFYYSYNNGNYEEIEEYNAKDGSWKSKEI